MLRNQKKVVRRKRSNRFKHALHLLPTIQRVLICFSISLQLSTSRVSGASCVARNVPMYMLQAVWKLRPFANGLGGQAVCKRPENSVRLQTAQAVCIYKYALLNKAYNLYLKRIERMTGNSTSSCQAITLTWCHIHISLLSTSEVIGETYTEYHRGNHIFGRV